MRFSKILLVCFALMLLAGPGTNQFASIAGASNSLPTAILADGTVPPPVPPTMADGTVPPPVPPTMADGTVPPPVPPTMADGTVPPPVPPTAYVERGIAA